MLLAEGVISRDQYDRAVLDHAREGGTLGFHLVRAGAIDDRDLLVFLLRRFPVNHWTRQQLESSPPDAAARLPESMARSLRVVPLAMQGDSLLMGVTDPTNTHVVDEVSRYAGTAVQPVVISEDDMDWALMTWYPPAPSSPPPRAPAEEDPLPLTVRATREFESLAAPPPTDGRYGFTEDEVTPEPSESPSSIEDAFRAIPLVNRTIPKPRATARSTSRFARPEGSSAREAKVAISSGPPERAARESRPAMDSWSNPVHPRATSTTYSITSRRGDPGQTEDDLKRDSKPQITRRRTEGEIIAAMNSAYKRDAVISLALEHLMRFAGRAAFLAVKRSEIRGLDITGDLTSREAIRSFWIPLTTASTLARVAHDKQIHLGPIGRSPADSVLSAALGGRPSRSLIIPVVIRDRTIGLLYADRIDVDIPPWSRLERLSETMADNLAKILRKDKKR